VFLHLIWTASAGKQLVSQPPACHRYQLAMPTTASPVTDGATLAALLQGQAEIKAQLVALVGSVETQMVARPSAAAASSPISATQPHGSHQPPPGAARGSTLGASSHSDIPARLNIPGRRASISYMGQLRIVGRVFSGRLCLLWLHLSPMVYVHLCVHY